MSIADSAMAARAASMIARWGHAAQLLRNGALRDCVVGTLDYNPRAAGLGLADAKRVLMVAPLAIPPDHEQDELIDNGQRFAIVAPVKGPRPAETVIYYDLDVVYRAPYP